MKTKSTTVGLGKLKVITVQKKQTQTKNTKMTKLKTQMLYSKQLKVPLNVRERVPKSAT